MEVNEGLGSMSGRRVSRCILEEEDEDEGESGLEKMKEKEEGGEEDADKEDGEDRRGNFATVNGGRW
jgi:hypothetical protein